MGLTAHVYKIWAALGTVHLSAGMRRFHSQGAEAADTCALWHSATHGSELAYQSVGISSGEALRVASVGGSLAKAFADLAISIDRPIVTL